MMKTWSDLYVNFVCLSAMVANTEPNDACEQLMSRVLNFTSQLTTDVCLTMSFYLCLCLCCLLPVCVCVCLCMCLHLSCNTFVCVIFNYLCQRNGVMLVSISSFVCLSVRLRKKLINVFW